MAEHEQVVHSEDELALSVDAQQQVVQSSEDEFAPFVDVQEHAPLEKTAHFALMVQNTDPSQIAAQSVDAVTHSVDSFELGELIQLQSWTGQVAEQVVEEAV